MRASGPRKHNYGSRGDLECSIVSAFMDACLYGCVLVWKCSRNPPTSRVIPRRPPRLASEPSQYKQMGRQKLVACLESR